MTKRMLFSNEFKYIIISLSLMFFLTLQTYSQDDGRLIKIPVVFHVIYGDKLPDKKIDPEANTTMKLPKEKIEAELADLNADFQNLNTDLSTVRTAFKKVIGNPKIQFYLDEIKYVKVDTDYITGFKDNLSELRKQSAPKSFEKFLNVYISAVKYNGGFTDGTAPVMPTETTDNNDVVSLSYEWIGLNYSLLSHEVGHWLGLWHTFDKKQFTLTKITDIPLQKEATNGECVWCPLNKNPADIPCVKCSPTVYDQLRSDWKKKGFTESNFNNFMDYSGCRNMFSVQQAQKMREVIRLYRPEIWNNQS